MHSPNQTSSTGYDYHYPYKSDNTTTVEYNVFTHYNTTK